MFAVCLAIAGLQSIATSAMAAADTSHYTKAQSQSGSRIYSAKCSACHGSKLQGGAAPALVGGAFAQSLKTTYPTTSKLLEFISTQMPVNNPGSLSKDQNTAVLAFILS